MGFVQLSGRAEMELLERIRAERPKAREKS
jgi:hypothetical protein